MAVMAPAGPVQGTSPPSGAACTAVELERKQGWRTGLAMAPAGPVQGTSSPSGAACTAVEVERKLFLTEAQRAALRAALPLSAERSFWDVYYDEPGYPLTSRDWWLRRRGGAWELKVPWAQGQALGATQSYEEVVGPAAVAARLAAEGLLAPLATPAGHPPLEDLLAAAGLAPFARLSTERTSLAGDAATLAACRASQLQVDLDTVTFDAAFAEPGIAQPKGTSAFVIAEVEVMAPKSQEAVDAAATALDAFLTLEGLQEAPKAHSKLLEYLVRFRPAHLEALCLAGVLPVERVEQLRAGV